MENKNLLANSKDYKRKNAYKIYQTEINKTIKGLDKSNDTNKFLNDIYKIVEIYFINKFFIDSVDFTYIKIIEKISLQDSSKALLKDFFDTISFARFVNMKLNKIEVVNMIDKINLVIKEVDND